MTTNNLRTANKIVLSKWEFYESAYLINFDVNLFGSPPQCPDRFCNPPSLLSSGYRGSFPGGKAIGA
jgi:hypothetical protein